MLLCGDYLIEFQAYGVGSAGLAGTFQEHEACPVL
jgi:hypothetical protein